MIEKLKPRTWGITARLVMVATIPALVMVLAVNGALYLLGRDDVERSLRERGELLAAALAETSYYPVVSGNVAVLDRNARELIKADESVASVEVLDERRRHLAGATAELDHPGVVFERPIRSDIAAISLFEQTEPHVSAEPALPSGFRPTSIAGYVRVEMSELPIERAQRRRLVLSGLLVLAAATLSGLIGLYLARSLQAPLAVVMRALRQIRGGDFNVGIERRSAGELGELQQTIAEMARSLRLQHEEMETLVAQRTAELQKALDTASRAHAQRRRLLNRAHAVLETDRRRIAGEIHDVLNTSFIVVAMKAQQIAALSHLPPDAAVSKTIASLAREIEDASNHLYAEAREIVKLLRPEIIDVLGLKGALAELVRGYDELHAGCKVQLFVGERFPDLRGQTAMSAYRLVQEALSNVVKHAQAREAWVKLDRHDTLPMALIVIADDGIGFDSSDPANESFGLLGMQERVTSAGGTFTIHSAPGKGTTLSIRLPIGAG